MILGTGSSLAAASAVRVIEQVAGGPPPQVASDEPAPTQLRDDFDRPRGDRPVSSLPSRDRQTDPAALDEGDRPAVDEPDPLPSPRPVGSDQDEATSERPDASDPDEASGGQPSESDGDAAADEPPDRADEDDEIASPTPNADDDEIANPTPDADGD